MNKRFKIDLLPAWSDRSSEYPHGRSTYIRVASPKSGTLQVSWASFSGVGKPPELTDEGLIQIATRIATSHGENVVAKNVGMSAWGRFGCVIALAPTGQRSQAWVVHKGGENILATHIGPNPPDESEIAEAEQIAMSIAIMDA
jgi:hypothetical protein